MVHNPIYFVEHNYHMNLESPATDKPEQTANSISPLPYYIIPQKVARSVQYKKHQGMCAVLAAPIHSPPLPPRFIHPEKKILKNFTFSPFF